jgi:putative transposase
VAYQVSERRACEALAVARSVVRYASVADRQMPLRCRLKELAMGRVAYGYRRLHILLRREGWPVNAKRGYRLYKEEGLAMRKKVPRRRVACVKREVLRTHAGNGHQTLAADIGHRQGIEFGL